MVFLITDTFQNKSNSSNAIFLTSSNKDNYVCVGDYVKMFISGKLVAKG
jgi:hypothetical protein